MEEAYWLCCCKIIQRNWKARKLLNDDALLTLYYSFLYPYLCYCNHVWGSTHITNFQKLIVLQKKVVRMISGSGFRDHTDPLFTNLSLIKFVDLDKYMVGKFMFRYHIDDVSHIFEGYFSKISDIHDYGTRTNDGLYAKHVKSDLGKTSISYRGPLIWNMIINTGINTDNSVAVFTKSLKKCIINGSL